eukprot:5455442-Pyramimonas_sp.AAC.1
MVRVGGGPGIGRSRASAAGVCIVARVRGLAAGRICVGGVWGVAAMAAGGVCLGLARVLARDLHWASADLADRGGGVLGALRTKARPLMSEM